MTNATHRRRTNEPVAYCRERNCSWVGEIPAVAVCPTCGSRQLGRMSPVELAAHEAAALLREANRELLTEVSARLARDEAPRVNVLRDLRRRIRRAMATYKRQRAQKA